MENKNKLKNQDKKDHYDEVDDITNVYFKKKLNTDELKNKYLDLLNQRIDENGKSLNKLLMIMFFLVIAFPLILETKISEISVGPFKLKENSFALYMIPSIFAFCHYKVIQVQILLNDQITYFKTLASVIFNHRDYSIVSNLIAPYAFLRSTYSLHFTEKSTTLIRFLKIFWTPITLGIVILPYWFIYYAVKSLYHKYGLDNIQEIMFFSAPILMAFFSIVLIIQLINRKVTNDYVDEEKEEVEKKL